MALSLYRPSTLYSVSYVFHLSAKRGNFNSLLIGHGTKRMIFIGQIGEIWKIGHCIKRIILIGQIGEICCRGDTAPAQPLHTALLCTNILQYIVVCTSVADPGILVGYPVFEKA